MNFVARQHDVMLQRRQRKQQDTCNPPSQNDFIGNSSHHSRLKRPQQVNIKDNFVMHLFIPHEQQPEAPATPYRKQANNTSACKLSKTSCSSKASKQQDSTTAATTIDPKPKQRLSKIRGFSPCDVLPCHKHDACNPPPTPLKVNKGKRNRKCHT